MKTFLSVLTTLMLATSASAQTVLVNAWETGADFLQPESISYHSDSKSLFVSNVNGNPNDADGNGFISQVALDGDMLEQHWIDGLDAPKGMAISGNTLYVADIDKLVEIDINNQRIVRSYPATGAKFLNDVTIDKSGNVYVSDMMTNRIYRLSAGKFEIWMETAELEAPNGLLVEQDKLVVGSWGNMTEGFATDVPGHLKQIDIASKKLISLGDATPVGNLDGVEADGHGNYLVTDWMNGRLLLIQANGKSKTLLVLEQGSADHTVLPEFDLVIIPMMMTNQLKAFRVK